MSNNANVQMITLKSSDGEEFTVTKIVAKMSETISSLIEDNCIELIEDSCAKVFIPLPRITAKILTKVIKYCEKYVFDEEDEDWDREFVNVDPEMIFRLIHAANYLAIQGLEALTCKKMVDQMANMSLEEIHKIFDIENDYISEEEAAVHQE